MIDESVALNESRPWDGSLHWIIDGPHLQAGITANEVNPLAVNMPGQCLLLRFK